MWNYVESLALGKHQLESNLLTSEAALMGAGSFK